MHPDAKAGRFKVLASHSAVNTLATSCKSSSDSSFPNNFLIVIFFKRNF